MPLKFSEKEIGAMLEAAEKQYPRECIGAIVGDENSHNLVPLTNVQDQRHKDDPKHFTRDARTGYFVDPKEVFDLVKKTEEAGKKILAFYHSHPDHHCFFSEEDHSAAVMFGEPVYPDAVYIIISVFNAKVKEALLFSWDGKTYSPAEKLPLP